MSSPAPDDHPEVPLFSDGLGERVVAADGATGELLQILRLRPALTAVPSFEFALRERAARLANFRHACYARVRRVDRAMSPESSLAVVSDHLEGTRLSDILRVAHEHGLQLDINAALCLIRELVPAVAMLHENARDVAHGLIAAERLLVSASGRLVIVEHVLGAAIEQLQYTRDRLWQEFRVAMPPSAGLPRFDHRADVTGMGLVALSLILGRPLEADEYPQRIPALLDAAHERTALGEERPLSAQLRTWLARTLQLDVRRAFASAPEALAALEELVADTSIYVAAPVALETFLSRYSACLLEAPLAAASGEAAGAFVAAPTLHAAAPALVIAPEIEDEALEENEELEDGEDESRDEAAELQDLTALLEPARPQPLEEDDAYMLGELDEPQGVLLDADEAQGAEVYELLTPRLPQRMAAPEVFHIVPPAGAPHGAEAVPALDAPAPGVPEPASGAPRALFNPDAPFTAEPVAAAPPARSGAGRRIVVAAAIVLAVAGAGVVGLRTYGRSASAPALGALAVQSNPAGVQVFIDGVDRGRTPARITLAPGAHILELRGKGVPRVIPLNVTAGAEVSQYLEFAEAPATGQLAVESDPAGATVVVDGTVRGVAPVTIPDLAPGDHQVELRAEGATAKHTVSVQAGGTASLVVPMAAAAAGGPVSGWLVVKAPFTIEVREQGRLLGTTEADRIMLASGRHELELVSETLGYRATRVVTVMPGKVLNIAADLPQGSVSLNASPWAEVWIDGQRAGETPIGNLAVPIGPHEIVFKHPQFGEKRHAVSVTAGAPVRLSVDMK